MDRKDIPTPQNVPWTPARNDVGGSCLCEGAREPSDVCRVVEAQILRWGVLNAIFVRHAVWLKLVAQLADCGKNERKVKHKKTHMI